MRARPLRAFCAGRWHQEVLPLPQGGPVKGTHHRSQAGPPQHFRVCWCLGGVCVIPPVPEGAGLEAEKVWLLL